MPGAEKRARPRGLSPKARISFAQIFSVIAVPVGEASALKRCVSPHPSPLPGQGEGIRKVLCQKAFNRSRPTIILALRLGYAYFLRDRSDNAFSRLSGP